jgi:hypothetical protein
VKERIEEAIHTAVIENLDDLPSDADVVVVDFRVEAETFHVAVTPRVDAMKPVQSNPQPQGIEEIAGRNGCNPAPGLKNAPVAQGIERCPAEAEVARSNRAGRISPSQPAACDQKQTRRFYVVKAGSRSFVSR